MVVHDVKLVDKCRICGSLDLTPIFSLGELYVSDLVGCGPDLITL